MTEFATSMFKLYSSDFGIKMKLIFDLFDFDKDGAITKEDVSLLLSHVPLDKQNPAKTNYWDRAQSQEELTKLMEVYFGAKTKLSLEDYG